MYEASTANKVAKRKLSRACPTKRCMVGEAVPLDSRSEMKLNKIERKAKHKVGECGWVESSGVGWGGVDSSFVRSLA